MSVHFGSFLARARAVRGLTLEALAAAAQVSAGTISHAKNKAKCPWKPTVRHAVLRALHRRVALSGAELGEAIASGLIESEHVATEVLRVSDPSMRTLADTGKVRHAFKAFLETCGSSEERVFQTVGRMIAQLGAEQTANIVQAVAASIAAGAALISRLLPGALATVSTMPASSAACCQFSCAASIPK